jgi:Ca-activated chloride channel family protein
VAKTEGLTTEGRLDAFLPNGKTLGTCPLRHTEVTVDISGFIARVTVHQEFHNPFKDKIEAVYVFPLSQDGAVDRMTMRVGNRVIKGEIKERNEARAIYEQAKAQGKVASLLDQERPNIFTQSVANIEPGEQVDITISYSETLKWKDGEYQFSFPMVVGPRYMPGAATGVPTTGWAPPTDQVPDADKISPPIPVEGTRAGHDISLTVNLNAGIPIQRLDSRQHTVDIEYPSPDRTQAIIKLAKKKTIPNKDFVLIYQTATDEIADTVLTHTDKRGKFFTLVLQPPRRVRNQAIVPKEMFFVIDSSGSMSGFPIETAKQAMRLCIEGLHEKDTLQLMTFSGHTSYCFEEPVPNTAENRRQALHFLEKLHGGGGTEMMNAIRGCLEQQDDAGRVRVVCFMTDGYVGNDMQIIDAVRRNAGTARVFAFGIGTSVNRYLLDNMARAGRGEVQYILDNRDAQGAAERFYQRVRTPVLTDVKLDFANLKVTDLFPKEAPDLFSSTPIVIKGQYKEAGRGTVRLSGKTGEGQFERKIDVTLPAEEPKNDVLAPLWARAKVDELMNQDLAGIQRGQPKPAQREEILGLGLRFQIMTQFTSFVAVEKRITTGGPVRTVAVPVEMPEGVSREGVFGAAGTDKTTPARGEFQRFDIGDPEDLPPAEMDVDPTLPKPGHAERKEDYIDDSPTYTPRGGGIAMRPADAKGADGYNVIVYGKSANASGSGGDGNGFGGRGSGKRKAMLAQYGGTQHTERAVTGALIWLARHQDRSNGSWSLKDYNRQCRGGDVSCAGPGRDGAEAAATACGLLPFLGAGQTHKSKGPYQKTIFDGVNCLIKHQKPDGDLSADAPEGQKMLAHALATTALCEAYGLTGDKNVGQAAQAGVRFIIAAQDKKTGGWSARPGLPPCTSITVWQLMALTSAKASGLSLSANRPETAPAAGAAAPAKDTASAPADVLELAAKFLDSVQAEGGTKYGETSPKDVSDRATAMALLARQYLGWKRDKPAIKAAIESLAEAGPAKNDIVYNLFATMFMHNCPGYEWDLWNRQMRRLLVDSQVKDGSCANGSWPVPADADAAEGSRLFQTAVNTMVLEVYYRYLPLYKTPAEGK